MALTSQGDVQNEKTNLHKTDRKEKPMTKVVVRRLPPGITQEEFLTQISPYPKYNYIYTVKGDASLGENSYSRAYINFVNADDIYDFKEKFDNYVFVDLKGHEYPAVVEFAAFQKIPKRRNKSRTDPKCGTIESDPVYLDFLESLKAQPINDEKPEYSYQPLTENKTEGSTPLLDYVKQRRMDRQRIREEKREERKRKDLERKRIKDDERRRRYEEKSPTKTVIIKAPKVEDIKEEAKQPESSGKREIDNTKAEKAEEKSFSKYRDRKYEDRKVNSYKSKYSRDYEKRDYKSRRDDYRDYRNKPFDDYKREPEKFTKKVKKYSERREERKSALKKFEDHETGTKSVDNKESISTENNNTFQEEETTNKDDFKEEQIELSTDNRKGDSENEKEFKGKNKENDPRIQRRIRNKDRPTMAIYQPGMLRKKGPEGNEEKPSKMPTYDKDT